MKLLELHLDGFGRLVNRTFTFSPGLNLVYGPNEAGKSTLQRAIMAMLYGYLDEGYVKQEQRSQMSADRPWDAKAPFAGRMVYALDNGHHFEISRAFEPNPHTALFALPGRVDISNTYRRATEGRLFFADEQLGMSRSVFANVCSVRQAQLAALDESAAASVTATITRLSSSGSSEATSDEALKTIDAALKNEIGTRNSPTKPWRKTSHRLSQLEEGRSAQLRARDDLLVQIATVRQAEEEVDRLSAECQKWRYLAVLAKRASFGQQQAATEELAKAVSESAAEMSRWARYASFPANLRDQVLVLEGQRNRLQRELRQAEQRAIDAEESLRPLRSEMDATVQRIAALENARTARVDQKPFVDNLYAEWQRAKDAESRTMENQHRAVSALSEAEMRLGEMEREVAVPLRIGRPGLGALQQSLTVAQGVLRQAQANMRDAEKRWAATRMSEEDFSKLELTAREIRSGKHPAPVQRQGCKPFQGSKQPPQPQAPAELAIYDQLRPIYDDLSLTQAQLTDAETRLRNAEAEARMRLGLPKGTPVDADLLARLGSQLDNHLRAQTVVEQAKVAVDDAARQVQAAAETTAARSAALASKLAEVGCAGLDEERGVAAFKSGCQRREQLAQQEAVLERLRLRAAGLQREDAERLKQAAALEETENQLVALLKQAGIDCPAASLAWGLTSFREQLDNHTKWVRGAAAYEEAKRRHDDLVHSQQSGSLDASLAELDVELARMRATNLGWAALEPQQSAQEYAAQEKRAELARAEVSERLRRLNDSIERASSSLQHLAERDEEASQVQRQLTRLEWYRDVLQLASDELVQAKQEYQQEFAPRLEALISEPLGRVTGGRYSQLKVDASTLALALKAPERADLVGVGQLSTGTRELIYLLLRAAIGRLLSRSSERLPLMMDDPLVQFDRSRQERALRYLCELGAETQLFLFTKDDWTCEWLQANGDGAVTATLRL